MAGWLGPAVPAAIISSSCASQRLPPNVPPPPPRQESPGGLEPESGARQRQSGRHPPRSCLHLACAAPCGHLIYGPCWPELCHAANDRLGEGGGWLVEDTVAGKDLMAARLGMAWPVRQLLGVKGGQGGFSERGPLATRQLPPQSSRFDPRSIMLSREQQETLPTVNRG